MGKFLKNVISNDNENKSKKKIENIVFLIIILIATLIIINIIWKDEKEPSDTTNSAGKVLADSSEKMYHRMI